MPTGAGRQLAFKNMKGKALITCLIDHKDFDFLGAICNRQTRWLIGELSITVGLIIAKYKVQGERKLRDTVMDNQTIFLSQIIFDNTF